MVHRGQFARGGGERAEAEEPRVSLPSADTVLNDSTTATSVEELLAFFMGFRTGTACKQNRKLLIAPSLSSMYEL